MKKLYRLYYTVYDQGGHRFALEYDFEAADLLDAEDKARKFLVENPVRQESLDLYERTWEKRGS